MKLVTFEANGKTSYGSLSGDKIIDLGAIFGKRFADLRAVLEAGAMPELAMAASGASPGLALVDIKLLPVIPNPQKIFCVGLNYKTHVAETKRADSDYPAIFTRFGDSLTAHSAPLRKPKISHRFDFEGELAVVIGKGGRNITQANAMAHIAGYACFNDGSVRDWQRHTHQWTPGKNFPETGAFGPCLTTPDEIPDIGAVTLTTRLNGHVVQQAPLSDLIFTLPVIIEYISSFTPLMPGDVIATGTPGGVGDKREPPLYMQDGDTVEVEITRIGLLRNTVREEA